MGLFVWRMPPMYGKIFGSCFEGSMCGAGPVVFSVWAYCIAKADKDGTVLLNPMVLAAIIGTGKDDVQLAIDFLTSSDSRSKNSEHEGRRLLHQTGHLYFLVSHAQYQGIKSGEDRREYMREYMRRKREKEEGVSNSANTKFTKANPTSTSTSTSTSVQDGEMQEGKGATLVAMPEPKKANPFRYDLAQSIAWIPCTKPTDPQQAAVCRPQEDPSPGAGWEMAIPQSWVDEWHEAYPNVFIPETLKEIRQKIRDGGKYVKTPQGMRRFLGAWMQREQNGGR
jgi:hypothetical protein